MENNILSVATILDKGIFRGFRVIKGFTDDLASIFSSYDRVVARFGAETVMCTDYVISEEASADFVLSGILDMTDWCRIDKGEGYTEAVKHLETVDLGNDVKGLLLKLKAIPDFMCDPTSYDSIVVDDLGGLKLFYVNNVLCAEIETAGVSIQNLEYSTDGVFAYFSNLKKIMILAVSNTKHTYADIGVSVSISLKDLSCRVVRGDFVEDEFTKTYIKRTDTIIGNKLINSMEIDRVENVAGCKEVKKK